MNMYIKASREKIELLEQKIAGAVWSSVTESYRRKKKTLITFPLFLKSPLRSVQSSSWLLYCRLNATSEALNLFSQVTRLYLSIFKKYICHFGSHHLSRKEIY